MTYRTFDGTSQTETIVDGRFSSSGDIALADGTATQGAIYFADDKNTGIYSPSNDSIAFTTAGSAALTIANNDATFVGDVNCKDIILTDEHPMITFTDNNENPDFRLKGNSGAFEIEDVTNDRPSLTIYNDNHIDIHGNLDVGAGIDVTGLATFNTGTAGTVKIQGTSTGTNVNTGDAGTYLQLRNLSTNADTFTVLQGADGTGQGTSQIAFVNLVDDTNQGQMVFSTRPAGGSMTSALTLNSTQNASFAGDIALSKLKKVSFRDSGTQRAYIELDSGDDVVYYGAGDTDTNHIFYADAGKILTIQSDGIAFESNKGINFSAVGTGGSSTSSLLDDYEEGTWTPGFAAGFNATGLEITNGTNGAIAKGWYTKIGDLVTAQFYMKLGTSGTSTTNGSQIKINGCPFDAQDTSEFNGGGNCTYVDLASTVGEVSEVVATYGPDPGTAIVQLYRGSQAYYASNAADQSGKYIIGMITYKV